MNVRVAGLLVLSIWGVTVLACRGSRAPAPAPSEIAVDIHPRGVELPPAGTTSFTSLVTGTSDTSVSWSVLEPAGGSVDGDGKYTAPGPAGLYHVQVTSRADPTKSATATVMVTAARATLRVAGRHLLDACGNPLVVRGPEQVLGYGMEGPGDAAGHFDGLIDQIASTGANAVRLLPDSSPGQPFAGWTPEAITRLAGVLTRACTVHHLVVYLSYVDHDESGTNRNARASFWSKQAVKDLVDEYGACLVLDALQEVAYWNVDRWRADAVAAVDWFRARGYTQPLDILSNGYGRDLPAIVDHGAEVVARDPLGKVILGWQAYWGRSYCTGDWAGTHGLSRPTSPADGIRRAAELPFVVQVGLVNMAEPERELVDFQGAMSAAQVHGVGWLWWWGSFNGFVDDNILTNSQYWDEARLRTPYGPTVVWTHPAGIHNTAVKACAP